MSSNTNEKDYFDLRKTYEWFQKSLIDEDDINIESYLEAYKELCKFCDLLGSVFQFVGKEIVSKSSVMHELRNNCQGDYFDSLKKMIEYEKSSNLLFEKNYVSGCRTLLRLHRGLDFIRTFLKQVAQLSPEDSTSSIGAKAYYETLGNYHSWFLRQGAYIAMNFLPTKKTLLVSVCGSKFKEIEEVLPLMLEATDKVYETTHQCYETHQLLDLP